MSKGLEWTNNEYKLSGTAKDSKSLKYKTFAIACCLFQDKRSSRSLVRSFR